jgi:hypothetical protein
MPNHRGVAHRGEVLAIACLEQSDDRVIIEHRHRLLFDLGRLMNASTCSRRIAATSTGMPRSRR